MSTHPPRRATPKVSFYFPDAAIVGLPSRSSDFAAWQAQLARANGSLGPAAWTVQTFLVLKEHGLECELVDQVPSSGIVFAHRVHCPRRIELRRERFWICLLADRDPHPYANFHILQNPTQNLRLSQPSTYVRHWPQPGLVPRKASQRRETMNVCYFGETENLVADLGEPAFKAWCESRGMKFTIVPRDAWHDYSDCDVVLAVRSFGTDEWHHSKPATKLFNAWLAGVPAILGAESAYRVEGRRGENYLEALDLSAVRAHLESLSSDLAMRDRLTTNGLKAAANVSVDATAANWIHLIETEVFPRFAKWKGRFIVEAPILRLLGRVREGLVWRLSLISSGFRP